MSTIAKVERVESGSLPVPVPGIAAFKLLPGEGCGEPWLNGSNKTGQLIVL